VEWWRVFEYIFRITLDGGNWAKIEVGCPLTFIGADFWGCRNAMPYHKLFPSWRKLRWSVGAWWRLFEYTVRVTQDGLSLNGDDEKHICHWKNAFVIQAGDRSAIDKMLHGLNSHNSWERWVYNKWRESGIFQIWELVLQLFRSRKIVVYSPPIYCCTLRGECL
jgi:hypothetical protein